MPDLPPLQSLNRRQLLVGGSALTLSLAFAPRAFAAGSMVTTVFGGRYEQEYKRAIVDPFVEKSGTEVLLRLGAPGEWVTNARVNAANPQIDMLLLPYPDSTRAVMDDIGLPLTVEDIPNLANVNPLWFDQYDQQGVGLDYIAYGIAARSDQPAPTAWADLWKPEFAGKIALPDIASSGAWEMLVVASRINGGTEDDLSVGLEAIKALKPNVARFYKNTVEGAQLLESGEVPIVAMTADSRAWALVDAGVPVSFIVPSEGAMVGMVSYHIAKNSPNAEACKAFINYALSKEAQEAFCNAMSAGPVIAEAELSGIAAERVPPLDSLLLFDWKKVVPQMAAITERWNREIAR